MLATKNKKIIYCIILGSIVIAFGVRAIFFNFISGDINGFIIPWIKHYSELSLGEFLKDTMSDYPIVYNYVLFIFSKTLPSNGYVYAVKIFSILFDISSSFAVYMILKTKLSTLESSIFFAASLFLPTIVWNSGGWGQCDSIYTSFLLWSLYFLIIKKPTLSLMMFSFSFVNKIHAIYLAPFLFLMLLKKRYKIYHFFLIPGIYFIAILPAIIAGHPILHLLFPYSNWPWICRNCPNLWSLFMLSDKVNTMSVFVYIFVPFAFLVCLAYVIFFYKHVQTFDTKNIILLAAISIFICVFTLPKMHERYFYAIDILSLVIFALYRNKYTLIAFICANIASILSYIACFKQTHAYAMVGSLFMIAVIVFAALLIIRIQKKPTSS